jgi:cyclopropane-fatty-acyl-phospholipid synthase
MRASLAITLAERGLVPLPGLRLGVRSLLRQRLREAARGPDVESFVRSLEQSPIAFSPERANEQHYELPPEFFELALGPRLKYSGAYWADGVDTLAEAEDAMLDLTCARARLADGQDVLELGCGWGSLTLHMARRYPGSRTPSISAATSRPGLRRTCAS